MMNAVTLISIFVVVKTFISSETIASESVMREECKLRPIIHHLKYPGCVPKSIPSFACQGHCSSYVQVKDREKFIDGFLGEKERLSQA